MIAHDLRVLQDECVVAEDHARRQRMKGPPNENCIVTECVAVTSDVELQVDPAVMIVGPCAVLVLEDVDGCVFIRQSKSRIPVK